MLGDKLLRDGRPFERLPLAKAEFHLLAGRRNPQGRELIDRLNDAFRALPLNERFNPD